MGGNDTLRGDDCESVGADWLYGGDGNDQLNGGWGSDQIYGGNGNDVVQHGEGSCASQGDTEYGPSSWTYQKSQNNNDYIWGGAGDDRLEGGYGDDWIRGEADRDEIFGDDGNDWLFGGDDDDKLTGGWGAILLLAKAATTNSSAVNSCRLAPAKTPGCSSIVTMSTTCSAGWEMTPSTAATATIH